MGVFSNVSGFKPHYTAFHPDHANTVSMGFGELVPMFAIEMVPGDTFTIREAIVGRLTSALIAPALCQFDLVTEAFFCPNRLLMGHDANFPTPVGEPTFEEVWKGGQSGNEEFELPIFGNVGQENNDRFFVNGIMDSLGEQIDVPSEDGVVPISYTNSIMPHTLVHRAYRWIWNEYYRNEFLQDEIQVSQFLGDGSGNDETYIQSVDYDKVFYRSWRRDYFTSALPFQQFGDAPALPIEGVLPVVEGVYPSSVNVDIGYQGILTSGVGNFAQQYRNFENSAKGSTYILPRASVSIDGSESKVVRTNVITNIKSGETGALESGSVVQVAENNPLIQRAFDFSVSPGLGVDLSNAVTFDISELRTAFQIQKWRERNARAGVRYTEMLQSHFNVTPGDYRLQRPYFIGSLRSPWFISEVLQTSSSVSGSPQGNQAGQAICLSRGTLGKFRAMEYGYLIILVSVLPKAQYQQGLSRHFSRRTGMDFFSPEFSHLSEQAILNKEIFVSGDPNVDNLVFGFTGIWNELRFLPSKVGRHMRTNVSGYSLDYYHQARYFSETPVLNSDFITVGGTPESKAELMRIFEVQDEDPFVVEVGLNLKSVRPLPYEATPGLVDHF